MNLEDRIRSSAAGQGNRYRPQGDLLARVEHRRRQRAARRMTATTVAAVVLFGGGALALSRLDDRGGDTDVAGSTIASVVSSESPTTVQAPTSSTAVATTAPPPTTTSTAVTVPVATVPAVSVASDANVPSPTVRPDGTTGLSEFWNVPRYGSEPVRGSGCGSNGQLGDTIPDGLWAGFIVDDGSDGIVGIDVLCVYAGAAGDAVITSGSGTVLTTTPDYVIVNNSTRVRFMPMDADVALRLGARDAAGRCLDSRSTTSWSDIPADRQTWIRIHGGRITWIIADCPPA
jgi:hypothetical protein